MQKENGKNCSRTIDKKLIISIVVFAVLAMMVLVVVSMDDGNAAGQNDDQKIIKGCSGICGDGVTFTFDETTGKLDIVKSGPGTGEMYDFKYTRSPWESVKGLIKSVKITGVKSIGSYAFDQCISLTQIEIPGVVKSIGSFAFCGCGSLTSISLPDGVKIGGNAFLGCSSLSSIVIPGTATIDEFAFDSCTGLTDVTFMEGTKYIPGSIFRNCSALKHVDIPNGVESIGDHAFQHCALKSVTIPGSVKNIGDGAFVGCASLCDITLGYGVESIEFAAFSACRSLKSITIPGSVKYIGSMAFVNCTSLCDITVGYGVKGIHPIAFPSHKFQMHDGMPVAPNDKNFPYHEYKGETPDKMVAQNESGLCGDRVAFYFDYSTGEMRIDSHGGSGKMYDFEVDNCPWGSIKGLIKSVEITGVKNIGNFAFVDCSSLVSVEFLCDDAVSIGEYSFDGCKSLRQVKLPDSIKMIGSSAFRYCESLESIDLPSNLVSVSDYTFVLCTSLKSITIPGTVKSIGKDAFNGCSSLESIDLPSNLCVIADYAFSGCKSLKSITIPDKVEYIGHDAFNGCELPKSITIPGKVKYIGSNAFGGCTSLCYINVGYGVKGIAANAFPDHKFQKYDGTPIAPSDKHFPYHEYKGTSTDKMVAQNESGLCGGRVTFYFDYLTGEMRIDSHGGSGVMYDFAIGARPWESVKELIKSVNVCEGVQSISSRAFAKCASLESVKLPESIKVIGAFAFSECTSLPSIVIPKNVSVKHSVFCDCLKLTDVTFMDGVEEIGDGVFKGCISLKNVEIPDSMRFIGDCAFSNCKALDAIQIPNTVRYIGAEAFSGCTSLKSINLPDDVRIGSKAFDNCKSLLEISVGKNDGTNEIASDAFPNHKFQKYDGTPIVPSDKYFPWHEYKGTSTDKMVVQDENGWCGDGLEFHFYYPTGELTISRYGGKGQMDKYSSADAVPWSVFRNEIKSVNICEGVQSIGSRAFAKCTSLESVKLPESIKVIGAFAFGECTSLPSIVIPKNVSMKHSVFCDCLKLTDVTFMDGVEEIGSGVFKGCISLKNVEIPDSVKSIGKYAFSNCKALDAIQIPNGVKCIGIGAFSGCISLKSVSLPDDVKIGSKAFDNCKSLLEISVGKNDGTEKIASDAFPSHKFFLADGREVRPGDAEFAGHTYRGSSVDKMVAAEPVDSESLNVCSAADHFDQSRFFCPIRSA